MRKSTYLIKYEVLSQYGTVLKSGLIKVKNKTSPIQAQISLEAYLKRKVSGTNQLVVKTCKEDSVDSILKNFGDIFGKDNPFGL